MNARVKGPPLGPLDDLIGLQLRLAQLRFFASYYEEFGELALSPAENAVLALLAEHAGIRQGELGDILRIKRSNMTKVMRALEQRGLIWRVAPEDDGRAFEVRLTDRGHELQRTLATEIHKNDKLSASALTSEEQAELLRILKKLNRPDAGHIRQQATQEERVHG